MGCISMPGGVMFSVEGAEGVRAGLCARPLFDNLFTTSRNTLALMFWLSRCNNRKSPICKANH